MTETTTTQPGIDPHLQQLIATTNLPEIRMEMSGARWERYCRETAQTIADAGYSREPEAQLVADTIRGIAAVARGDDSETSPEDVERRLDRINTLIKFALGSGDMTAFLNRHPAAR